MIERDDAVRIVGKELARSHQAWVAAGVEQFPRSVVVHVDDHELVWKVYVQSEEYARTRNAAAMLVGHGPFLVDRADGGLHSIGVVSEAACQPLGRPAIPNPRQRAASTPFLSVTFSPRKALPPVSLCPVVQPGGPTDAAPPRDSSTNPRTTRATTSGIFRVVCA
ncbi:YrhB domain-containing protein [Streptomyces sp. NPDC057966]|uniref:YrhB domain-containing protein n=1 Tax=Streptomyces sp. NPDC057966 TaxID=3346292 RepID=UPI0036EB430E